MQTFYSILGVTPDSEAEVIDAAYRALMKKHHPDRTGRPDDERSRAINEAYAVLKDPRKRRAYDAELKKKHSEPADAIVSAAASRYSYSNDRASNPTSKTCPDCAESVRQSARICRYCGYEFDGGFAARNGDDINREQQPRRWGLAVLSAIAGLLLFLWALANPNPGPEELRQLTAADEQQNSLGVGAENPHVPTASIPQARTAAGSVTKSIPKRIGQCTRSNIAWIGDRFGETNEAAPNVMGTAVRLADGLYVVSYEHEDAIWQSQVGDPVHVCLTSIPTGCPPGDHRGREYEMTNLRTQQRWNLPDSQHMCGGA